MGRAGEGWDPAEVRRRMAEPRVAPTPAATEAEPTLINTRLAAILHEHKRLARERHLLAVTPEDRAYWLGRWHGHREDALLAEHGEPREEE